jgi:hypothetical protein
MDPHSVLMGFRRKATSLGIHYRKDRSSISTSLASASPPFGSNPGSG